MRKIYEIRVEKKEGFEIIENAFISTDDYEEAMSFLKKRVD